MLKKRRRDLSHRITLLITKMDCKKIRIGQIFPRKKSRLGKFLLRKTMIAMKEILLNERTDEFDV